MPTLRAPSINNASRADKAPGGPIDNFNRAMRGMAWYQDWFKQRGLNPNNVQLSKSQRRELEALAARNLNQPDAFKDMEIDPAGNLNTEHGFASQPTWLKAVEIGAPLAVGDYFSGGALHNLLLPHAGSGSTVAGSSTASSALPTLATTTNIATAASSMPSLAGLGTLGSTAGGLSASSLPSLGNLAGPLPPAAKGTMKLGPLGKIPWKKIFNKSTGLDPTMLALSGLSMLGGEDSGGGNQRGSYTQANSITDPRQALYQALKGSNVLGEALAKRGPVQLRSAYVPPPPVAVDIPGVPFQIGGGLGRDPALNDPSLLEFNRNRPVNDAMAAYFGGADQPVKPARGR